MYLLTSSSKEVRHLARIFSHDAKCTVFKNIQLIEQISGPNPWDYASWRILENIENIATPPNNNWRMKMLLKLELHVWIDYHFEFLLLFLLTFSSNLSSTMVRTS